MKPGMFATWGDFARFLALVLGGYAAAGAVGLALVWALMGAG